MEEGAAALVSACAPSAPQSVALASGCCGPPRPKLTASARTTATASATVVRLHPRLPRSAARARWARSAWEATWWRWGTLTVRASPPPSLRNWSCVQPPPQTAHRPRRPPRASSARATSADGVRGASCASLAGRIVSCSCMAPALSQGRSRPRTRASRMPPTPPLTRWRCLCSFRTLRQRRRRRRRRSRPMQAAATAAATAAACAVRCAVRTGWRCAWCCARPMREAATGPIGAPTASACSLPRASGFRRRCGGGVRGGCRPGWCRRPSWWSMRCPACQAASPTAFGCRGWPLSCYGCCSKAVHGTRQTRPKVTAAASAAAAAALVVAAVAAVVERRRAGYRTRRCVCCAPRWAGYSASPMVCPRRLASSRLAALRSSRRV